MEVVNSDVEPGEQPVVQSRYSIVLATAKRARQLIDGAEPMVSDVEGRKPLSIAIDELYNQKIKVLGDEFALVILVAAAHENGAAAEHRVPDAELIGDIPVQLGEVCDDEIRLREILDDGAHNVSLLSERDTGIAHILDGRLDDDGIHALELRGIRQNHKCFLFAHGKIPPFLGDVLIL
jgi:DNA-directed RNA polymerase subunit omega